MADGIYTIKRCSRCNGYLPLSSFHKDAKKPFGAASRCKECAKRVAREWLANNPERAQASAVAWYAKNSDAVKSRSREHYAANPEKHAEYARIYRIENKEKKLAADYAWQKANPEKHKNNKIAGSARRRARRKADGGSFSASDIGRILVAQRFKCAICRVSVKKKRHVDHIHPISKGGKNSPSNIQILCPTCNLDKRAKDPIDYMREIGRLL